MAKCPVYIWQAGVIVISDKAQIVISGTTDLSFGAPQVCGILLEYGRVLLWPFQLGIKYGNTIIHPSWLKRLEKLYAPTDGAE